MWHTRRHTGRLIAQTVLLLAIGLPSLVGCFCGMRDAATVLCGTVLPLLALLQWLWPFWEFRREAAEMAAKNTPITLAFTADTITVVAETVALQNATFRRVKDTVLWRVNSQWIVIPRRAVGEELWNTLTEETMV